VAERKGREDVQCLVEGCERMEERSETVVAVDWTKVRIEGKHEHGGAGSDGNRQLTMDESMKVVTKKNHIFTREHGTRQQNHAPCIQV
jgi:hypothetical protein